MRCRPARPPVGGRPPPRATPPSCGDGAPPTAALPRARDAAAAEAHAAAVSAYVAAWLDDEWPVPELEAAHAAIAQAAGAAYAAAAAVEGADCGDVLLAVGSTLSTHPAMLETFTDGFEVANRVCELVVFAAGAGVCCVSESDVKRLEACVGPLREV